MMCSLFEPPLVTFFPLKLKNSSLAFTLVLDLKSIYDLQMAPLSLLAWIILSISKFLSGLMNRLSSILTSAADGD
jgi:hypothetical protein